MRVAVLYDRMDGNAADPDHGDVLVQAEAVTGALRELGYDPQPLAFALNLDAVRSDLQKLLPAFVFNLVESVEGKGRLIHLAPCLLDALGMPYTGSGTDALYVTSNKLLTKKFLQGAGIPTPPHFSEDDLRDTHSPSVGTFIIKSVWEHASIGIGEDSVVTLDGSGRLHAEMKRRRQALGGACFAEKYIEGREFNLSMLAGPGGPTVLPPAEIRFDDYPPGKRRMVDYRAKWDEASFEYQHTPRSFEFSRDDDPLLHELKKLSLRCWGLFGLRGYARVDFRVDADHRPWVLEVNANPCLSPDAGFEAAVTRTGLSYRQMVERIIRDME